MERRNSFHKEKNYSNLTQISQIWRGRGESQISSSFLLKFFKTKLSIYDFSVTLLPVLIFSSVVFACNKAHTFQLIFTSLSFLFSKISPPYLFFFLKTSIMQLAIKAVIIPIAIISNIIYTPLLFYINSVILSSPPPTLIFIK